jgi:hypothetical protein
MKTGCMHEQNRRFGSGALINREPHIAEVCESGFWRRVSQAERTA